MAPLTKRWRKALAAAIPPAVIDPTDRLSKLPEEIQAQILSILPAQDAVRTCVLGRTWRHMWRFTRRLHITGKSVQDVRKFVDRLIHVRLDGLEVSPLDASEIKFDPWDPSEMSNYRIEFGDYRFSRSIELDDEAYACLNEVDMDRLNRWIRRVLECHIHMLRVDISARVSLDAYLKIGNMPLLVSEHLTRLELKGVCFVCACLNLDGCPALEHLQIKGCCFSRVTKMTSQSLKQLVITSCESLYSNRIEISVPRLVSLWLDNMDMRTPMLTRMPELMGAKVHIGSYLDECNCKDEIYCFHVMWSGDTSDIEFDGVDVEDSVYYSGQITKECLVLEGLAQAKNLVLIIDNSTDIFRRDLRWCPTFSMLKTLVLIEVYWRKPAADCSALACMLQHAPLLEKLTLIFDNIPRNRSNYRVEMKGYPDLKVKSTKVSQHLQIVEIKCEYVNETFLCILNFLGTLHICFEIKVTTKLTKEQQSH